MNFQLPDDIADLSSQLRAAEPQAPKQFKSLLTAAAERLDHFQAVAKDSIAALDEAAQLRVGQMDSDSRALDIQRQGLMAMKAVADRLRALA